MTSRPKPQLTTEPRIFPGKREPGLFRVRSPINFFRSILLSLHFHITQEIVYPEVLVSQGEVVQGYIRISLVQLLTAREEPWVAAYQGLSFGFMRFLGKGILPQHGMWL